MKTRLFMFTLAVVGIAFTGCDKDDDHTRIDREIETAFLSRYPDAARAEWEFKQGYYVADFWQNRAETEAWYTPQAVWHMTETDVKYPDLPPAVKTSFEQSEYAGWRIDDIDMLEYPDRETVYVIETEQGHAECDLWFSPDGVLVKAVPEGPGNGGGNNGGTHQPSIVLPAIKAFIAEKYPQARIVDVETERNAIEVDIVDGRIPREVVFSPAGEWTYTKTEVRHDIPTAVLNALNASQYGSWRIDDADHYLIPAGEYYLFELESGSREVKLKIDVNGNFL